MSTSVERVLPVQPDRFDMLSRQLERAKGLRESERIVQEIVVEATERNYDCYNLLRGVDIAANAILSPNKRQHDGGKRIIQGIETYFEKIGTCYKYYIPSLAQVTDPTPIIGKTAKLQEKVKRNLRSVHAKKFATPALIDFLNIAESIDMADVHQGTTFCIAPKRSSFQLDANYMAIQNNRDRIVSLKSALDTPGNDIYALRLPEDLLAIIQESSQNEVEGLPTIYTQKFGEVSIADIISVVDPIERAKLLLRFTASMPSGDCLWLRVAEGLFFTLPRSLYNIDPEKDFSNPDFSQATFVTQWAMTAALIMPIFNNEYQDDEFINSFRDAANNLSESSQTELAYMIIINLLQSSSRLKMINPDMSQNREIDVISSFAISHLKGRNARRMVIGDRAILHLMTNNQETIFQYMEKYFAGTIFYNSFRQGFNTTFIEQDYEADYRSIATGIITQHAGEAFVNTLQENTDVIKEIPIDLSIGRQVLTPETLNENIEIYNFAEGSLPYEAGMRTLTLSLDPNQQEPTYFLLYLGNNRLFAMEGEIDSEGNAHVVLEVDKQTQYLSTFINHMVTMSCTQLHKQEREEASLHPATSKPLQVTDVKQDFLVALEKASQKRTIHTTVPLAETEETPTISLRGRKKLTPELADDLLWGN